MSGQGWIWGIVALIIVVVGGWWALSQPSSPDMGTGPIKIGASLPLTGEAASYGEQIKPGIETAVKEINDAGGINGRMVEVIFEDDRCSAVGSQTVSKLVNIDQVTALIGPVCSAAAGPGLPIAQQAGVPAAIIASAPALTQIGDYIFRIYPSDSFQGKFGAEYVHNTLGIRSVAVLFVKNDWGQGLSDVFQAHFKELGGTIVDVQSANQDATDVRTHLTSIKAKNPELIYAPLYPAVGAVAVKQAKSLGITVPFFGGDGFETTEFASVPEAEGVMYTIGKFGNPTDFQAKVKAATGYDAGNLTGLGYDAMKVLAAAIAKAGTDRSKIRTEMAKTDIAGVSAARITFDAVGDLATGETEVHIIRNGKFEVYNPQ